MITTLIMLNKQLILIILMKYYVITRIVFVFSTEYYYNLHYHSR